MIEKVTEKCRQLRLKACCEYLPQVIETAAQKNWSPLQTIAHLFDLEIEHRWQNKISVCYQKSKLTDKPTIDRFDFNYHPSRKKQKNKIVDLTTLQFLKTCQDIILIGNPGVGKTFLAKAIA